MEREKTATRVHNMTNGLSNGNAHLATFLILAAIHCQLALGQNGTNVAPPQKEISSAVPLDMLDEAAMANELKRLDAICESLQLATEQTVMSRWLDTEASGGQLLYLPVAEVPRTFQSGNYFEKGPSANANWLKHFATARRRHALYWVEEAKRLCAAGDEWTAYRQLWRALRENPSNEVAKRVLGSMLQALNVRGKPRNSVVPHGQFGWPAGTYTRFDTANFQIVSRTDAATTIATAQQLERFYVLWTQVFYPFWAPPGVTQARLDGRDTRWQPRREFKVVLCKDRRDYLQTLGVSETNIGVSVGYYNPELRMAFFYSDPNLNITLHHELTHQLLNEGSQLKGGNRAGVEQAFWMVEGIALYMESLVDYGDHWSIGGWLAPRLQSARYRAIHDGYWPAWDDFNAGTMEKWKADPEITRLYTHAAGLTHFFLDKHFEAPEFDMDESRAVFYASLASLYQAGKHDQKLQEVIGASDAQKNYLHFLLARDKHLLSATNQVYTKELVLTRSQLSAESWQSLSRFENLNWLDLSFSNATSSDIAWIGSLAKLERLNLEGTAVDASTVALIARLPKLRELDLSQCNIDDEALAPLSACKTLESLWLSGTKASRDSLAWIEKLPKLAFIAVDKTLFTAQEAQELMHRIESRKSK